MHRIVMAAAVAGLVCTGIAAPAAAQDIDVATAAQDRVLGRADAPVTMVEYSSFTCPHCAHFNDDTLPALKEKYIDTGKVKLVFRDFPFDQLGLAASMLARCAPPERYFAFVDVLFRRQQQWARSENPLAALTQIGKLGGLSEDRIEACLTSQPLADAILQFRVEAVNRFNINSTPSFILNDGAARVEGAQPFDRFEQAIDRLLAQAPAPAEPVAPAAPAETAAPETTAPQPAAPQPSAPTAAEPPSAVAPLPTDSAPPMPDQPSSDIRTGQPQ